MLEGGCLAAAETQQVEQIKNWCYHMCSRPISFNTSVLLPSKAMVEGGGGGHRGGACAVCVRESVS